MTVKDTNPKDAVGSRKARWFSYVPLRVLVYLGLALFEGARKYGRHNYRVAGVRASVYVDAVVCGHLTRWMEGEDDDAESGMNHIDKAIASLVVLRDGMLEGNWVDDRPPSVQNLAEFMADADKKALALIERFPNPVPAYTIGDTRWKMTPDQLIGARLASAVKAQPRPLKPMRKGCRHSLTTVHRVGGRADEQINECCICHGEEPFVGRPARKPRKK